MLTKLGIFVLGLVSGLLVNYFSDVIPYRRSVVHPFCLNCGVPLSLRNYLFWPRRCPECQTTRPSRAWVVEIAFAFLAVFTWQQPEMNSWGRFFAGWIVITYFGIVVIIDLEHRLILYPVSLAGGVIGLAYGWFFQGLRLTVLGGIAGFVVMYGLYAFGGVFAKVVSRLRGRKLDEVALGFGDVNLTAVLGLLLGWPNILLGLFFSVFIAGLTSALIVGWMVIRRRFRSFIAIPYGPFLIIGATLLLFFPSLTQQVLAKLFPIFY